jgi:hypothetical protein
MTPFLHDGLAEGGAAVAVTTRSNWAALREALGRAAEQVAITDRDECYLRPAKTVASYETALQQLYQAGAPTVRVIGSAGETAARIPRQRVAAGPTTDGGPRRTLTGTYDPTPRSKHDSQQTDHLPGHRGGDSPHRVGGRRLWRR